MYFLYTASPDTQCLLTAVGLTPGDSSTVHIHTQTVWGTRTKVITLSRIQSRTVTGLLTGHDTLRRHLYLLGLSNSPLCRWCEAGEETLTYVLCECEVLASRRHAYLGSFFLEPGDIKNLNSGSIRNYSKVAGVP